VSYRDPKTGRWTFGSTPGAHYVEVRAYRDPSSGQYVTEKHWHEIETKLESFDNTDERGNVGDWDDFSDFDEWDEEDDLSG
jgi:hypothetical protein